jgi:antitoxin component YwqK of YwqJK toxin-antitoxin module
MPTRPSWRRRLFGIGALVAIALAGWVVAELRRPAVTARRAELELRDGVLHRRGEGKPFAGLLIDEWKPGVRRTEVTIRDGRAHGLTRGWFENGQVEVEENFVRGVSHGERTRWYDSGARRSSVTIREGQMVGVFREWHPNGRLARETPLDRGVAHGVVRGWDAQGRAAGVATVNHGTLVKRH